MQECRYIRPMKSCSSGKISYASQSLAEDALLDAWARNHYKTGQGPVNVYACEDCGNFHFTSKGKINERLNEALVTGQIERSRQAFDIERKWKRR